MSKKLGVCLKYDQTNYGSKLQALATVKVLERLGQDYEIIRYNKLTIRFLLKWLPRFFNTVFLHDRYNQIQKKIGFCCHPDISKKAARRNQMFRAFDKHFEPHLSEVYPSYEELKRVCPVRYDKVLSCSDQLWSPSALGSGFYNLMFAPEQMQKISWASSFGVSRIPWYQRSRTREYLNRIQRISVRENRGAQIVKELTGKDVPVLMDPVFSLDAKEWDELLPLQKAEWENYIFCYFLGDNPGHRAVASELARQTGMPIVTLRHLDCFVASDEDFGDAAPYDVDPERFLSILRNAGFVCTDSFHGSAFSVIFGKEFVVFDRYASTSANSKNSRIESLCDNLGLEGRRVTDYAGIHAAYQQKIDYAAVNEKLEPYRRAAMEYLLEALCEKK